MKSMVFNSVVCFIFVWIISSQAGMVDEVETQIRTILKVEKEGSGNAAAVPALRGLLQQPNTALVGSCLSQLYCRTVGRGFMASTICVLHGQAV